MFTLFVPYLICICIFYVIWQLNALNGISFQLLIYAISAIQNRFFSKKANKLLVHFRRLVLFSLVYFGLLFKKKK